MTLIHDTAVSCMTYSCTGSAGGGGGTGTNYRGPGCPGPDSVAYIFVFMSSVNQM
jgi:hypothetical protein